MHRRKFKLNATYGREAQDILAAFETCAAKVRFVKNCNECLHFMECQSAEKPVSTLGAYVAYIEIKVLPFIRYYMQHICAHKFSLHSKRPNAKEAASGACWVISVKVHNIGVRVPLFNEPDEHILNKCLRAYEALAMRLFDRGGK